MTSLRPSRRRAHRQVLALHFLGYTSAISDGWVYPSEVAKATGMSCLAAISALHALKLARRAESEWVAAGADWRCRYRLAGQSR